MAPQSRGCRTRHPAVRIPESVTTISPCIPLLGGLGYLARGSLGGDRSSGPKREHVVLTGEIGYLFGRERRWGRSRGRRSRRRSGISLTGQAVRTQARCRTESSRKWGAG